ELLVSGVRIARIRRARPVGFDKRATRGMIVIRISHAFRRSTIAAAVLAGFSASALAHHGFGLFQMNQEGTWSGTLTKMNLVNPHSYMEFDSVGEDGEIVHMRCEMRAASLLRRAGWDTSMFTPGAHVEIYGRPHRDDPTACYIETFTLDDSVVVNRNDLFAADGPVDFSNR